MIQSRLFRGTSHFVYSHFPLDIKLDIIYNLVTNSVEQSPS
jgi:hypothetical protein